jgi:hypothetical protein
LSQNPGTLGNYPRIAGYWTFIPPNMVIIGFDHPHISVLDFTGLLKWNSFDLKHWDRGCFHKWENPKMHGLFHGKSILMDDLGVPYDSGKPLIIPPGNLT